ncbi:hypothetical protein Tco_0657008 [Tanacetum coccineum]|uniref:Uncharacterized protein n=1 Tax=Tanacetum coccineum TaxID=301880 RepID=A0ABQ4XAC6_9ASTR
MDSVTKGERTKARKEALAEVHHEKRTHHCRLVVCRIKMKRDEGIDHPTWIGSAAVVGTGHSPHGLEDEGLVSVGRDSGTGAI